MRVPCTPHGVKEMTLLHVTERDLHPVFKLWQSTEKLKVSCLSKTTPEVRNAKSWFSGLSEKHSTRHAVKTLSDVPPPLCYMNW